MRFPIYGRELQQINHSQEGSICGDHGEGETPGSIPNPEAKPFSADGTALVKVWESRTSPDNYSKKGHLRVALFLFARNRCKRKFNEN
ncbi:hypothetical protein GM51_19110 [freshwater metagenome]|uniref:Uncharacterized protein n=1 Tax=freshwater metagenome TaxID=449393 RepID=A0A094QH63_9ZZZZ